MSDKHSKPKPKTTSKVKKPKVRPAKPSKTPTKGGKQEYDGK